MDIMERVEKYLQSHEPYAELDEDLVTLMHQARRAYTDELTGLANRAALVAEWPHLRRVRPVVMVMDLDDFKLINDTFGHSAGDWVLVEVALRLPRGGAMAVRLGGDEFVMVITCPLDHGVEAARKVAEQVAAPIRLPGGEHVSVKTSIGVTQAESDDLGRALAEADSAMYRAKFTRSVVAVYDDRCDQRPSEGRGAVRLRDRRRKFA